jgi:hypothetical protein
MFWYIIVASSIFLMMVYYNITLTSCHFDDANANVPALLATKQSYGVFDTIPDAGWRLLQQRARTDVQYMNPDKPEIGYNDPMLWYLNNLQVSDARWTRPFFSQDFTAQRSHWIVLVARLYLSAR